MKEPPTPEDGSFDMESDWPCEQCGGIVKFGDTTLSWCFNIICRECGEKEEKTTTKP